MQNNDSIESRVKELEELKSLLNDIDDKVLKIIKDLNWDYQKLLNENPHNMVTCSVNSQHRVPFSKIKSHEEKCGWRSQGYLNDEKPFSEFSGFGSHVTLTLEAIKSITDHLPLTSILLFLLFSFKKHGIQTREINKEKINPQTSAKLDQNFSREEKLAIYDYVILNTQKPKAFSDLRFHSVDKKEEKKEMTEWEKAAAERDAKRRRASYRNKVHTNRKTHTEILKEVIDTQMEAFREEIKMESHSNKNQEDKHEFKKHKHEHKKHKHSRKESEEKRTHSKSGSTSEDEDGKRRNKRKHRDKHSKHKEKSRKRSPETDYYSRSRFHDKHRKRNHKRRSHSPTSSYQHKHSRKYE